MVGGVVWRYVVAVSVVSMVAGFWMAAAGGREGFTDDDGIVHEPAIDALADGGSWMEPVAVGGYLARRRRYGGG